jgi:hypothetical protein
MKKNNETLYASGGGGGKILIWYCIKSNIARQSSAVNSCKRIASRLTEF